MTLFVQGHTKMQTQLSDTNTRVPFIHPQNCPLSSTLPVFTAPFMPPLGPGLCFQPHQGVHTHERTRANAPVAPVSLVLSALRTLNLYLQLQAWVIKSLRSKNYIKLDVCEVGLLPPPLLPTDSYNSLLPGLPASPLLPRESALSPAVGPLSLRAQSKPPTA